MGTVMANQMKETWDKILYTCVSNLKDLEENIIKLINDASTIDPNYFGQINGNISFDRRRDGTNAENIKKELTKKKKSVNDNNVKSESELKAAKGDFGEDPDSQDS